jgi:1,4-dihydroxy-6-naphthoate synthase
MAFSPCPNDTFVFHAWVHGLIQDAPPVRVLLADIDELNRLALEGKPDVVKLSFPAFAAIRDSYALLRCGGALGRACGPLVVVRAGSAVPSGPQALAAATVAIPGELTTAAFLLGQFAPNVRRRVVMRFDEIMPAVQNGEVDAGVIIHESRFTYPSYGLEKLADLGQWWEVMTGLPLPLGGIAVKRSLPLALAVRVEETIRASLRHAWEHPDDSRSFIAQHAQEMDPSVCAEHIQLYVNDFSLSYGAEGEAAIRHLLERAGAREAEQAPEAGVFYDELVP